MMSQCIVPSWNLSHQRQDLKLNNQGEEVNRSSHVDLDSHHNHFQQHQNFSQLVPMSNFEVTELTWENGQLAMHELGGMFPAPTTTTTSSPPKATWAGGVGRVTDTLESIVHQATYCNNKQSPNLLPASVPHQHSGHQNIENVGSSIVGSSGGKWAEKSGHIQTPVGPPPPPPVLMKKRTRSESENCAVRNTNDHDMSACASANAAFCKENSNNNNTNNNNDTTMMTWASYESPRSCTRTKTTTDEDSACHDGSTDKASMLDEVIEYLKQLQAQVQMMTNARFMPQIMMPLGMQQHLHQMSLLARVGMGAGLGMGLGMLDTTNMGAAHPATQAIPSIIHPTQVAAATSTFMPPGFVVPQMVSAAAQQPNPADPGTSNSAPLHDPYSTLLAQSMNIDLYNRIAALQRQQQASSQQTSNQLQSNHHVQRS